MVQLGVGKNMVRSIRFWAEVAGVIESDKSGGLRPSRFGREVIHSEGWDPYLENQETLWLLHWKIATCNPPLFAWDYLFNQWHRSDFAKSEVVEVFGAEAARQGRKLSKSTLETHFEVFLHSYLPTRSRKREVLEDNLDCPLVELGLIKVGRDRVSADSNRREPSYVFRVEEKPEISDELFAYCLSTFWQDTRPNEKVIDFRTVNLASKSPGQVFKLPDRAVRDRLERIARETGGLFTFEDTADLQQVRRNREVDEFELLDRIYDKKD